MISKGLRQSGYDRHNRMLETPMPRLIVSMAAPTTASQLVTIIYNTVDTYFVSQIGTSAAAAVGVVFSLMTLIQACGYAMGTGSSSLVSRSLGAERYEDACKYANSGLFGAVLIGGAVAAAGLACLGPMMYLLGSTETVFPYAYDYAKFVLLAAPVTCTSFVLNITLRAEGQAVYAMCGLCAGGILNAVLDPVFIFGLRLGTAGASLATLISQCVSFLILLLPFLRGMSAVSLGGKWISRSPSDYFAIVRTGFPTVCRQGMSTLASALTNIHAAAFDDAALAAITIANKIYTLVRSIVLGIGQGFQPVAGYNFGAGKKARTKEAFVFSSKLGTAVCAVFSALLLVTADHVIAWFRDDPEVIEMGAAALRIACGAMPFLTYGTFVNQMYQCLGFSAWATLLACCRQGIFFLPLIHILPHIWGLAGVQMTQPVSDILTCLVSIPAQILFFKRVLREQGPESRPQESAE